MTPFPVRALPRVAMALALWLVCGCTDKGDPVEPRGEPRPVSYDADIQPIFDATCAFEGCHGNFPSAALDLRAGVSHAQLVGVISVGYAPAVRVVPGDPAASVLYHKVAATGQFGGQMPVGGSLAAAQIESIRRWISGGATAYYADDQPPPSRLCAQTQKR